MSENQSGTVKTYDNASPRELAAVLGMDSKAFERIDHAYQKLLFDKLSEKFFPYHGSVEDDGSLRGTPINELSVENFDFLQFVANILSFFIVEAKTGQYSWRTAKVFPLFSEECKGVLSTFLNKEELDKAREFSEGGANVSDDAGVGSKIESDQDCISAALLQDEFQNSELDVNALLDYAMQDSSYYYYGLTGREKSDLDAGINDYLKDMPEGAEKTAQKKAWSNLIARFIVEFTDNRISMLDRLEHVLGNQDALPEGTYEIAKKVRQISGSVGPLYRKRLIEQSLVKEQVAEPIAGFSPVLSPSPQVSWVFPSTQPVDVTFSLLEPK